MQGYHLLKHDVFLHMASDPKKGGGGISTLTQILDISPSGLKT